MVLAFAVAVQAGVRYFFFFFLKKFVYQDPAQTKDKDMPSCCGDKVKTSNEAKGTCPFAKRGLLQKQAPVKPLRPGGMSPKAADLAIY